MDLLGTTDRSLLRDVISVIGQDRFSAAMNHVAETGEPWHEVVDVPGEAIVDARLEPAGDEVVLIVRQGRRTFEVSAAAARHLADERAGRSSIRVEYSPGVRDVRTDTGVPALPMLDALHDWIRLGHPDARIIYRFALSSQEPLQPGDTIVHEAVLRAWAAGRGAEFESHVITKPWSYDHSISMRQEAVTDDVELTMVVLGPGTPAMNVSSLLAGLEGTTFRDAMQVVQLVEGRAEEGSRVTEPRLLQLPNVISGQMVIRQARRLIDDHRWEEAMTMLRTASSISPDVSRADATMVRRYIHLDPFAFGTSRAPSFWSGRGAPTAAVAHLTTLLDVLEQEWMAMTKTGAGHPSFVLLRLGMLIVDTLPAALTEKIIHASGGAPVDGLRLSPTWLEDNHPDSAAACDAFLRRSLLSRIGGIQRGAKVVVASGIPAIRMRSAGGRREAFVQDWPDDGLHRDADLGVAWWSLRAGISRWRNIMAHQLPSLSVDHLVAHVHEASSRALAEAHAAFDDLDDVVAPSTAAVIADAVAAMPHASLLPADGEARPLRNTLDQLIPGVAAAGVLEDYRRLLLNALR